MSHEFMNDLQIKLHKAMLFLQEQLDTLANQGRFSVSYKTRRTSLEIQIYDSLLERTENAKEIAYGNRALYITS